MRTLFSTLFLFISFFSYAQNVGIGTTSPQGKLHVVGPDAGFTLTNLIVQEPNPASSAGTILTVGTATAEFTRFGPASLSTVAGVPSASLARLFNAGGALMMATNNNSHLHFVTNNIERMRLTGDGSLGLGTLAPDFKFHLQTNTGEAGLGIQNDLTNGYSLLSVGYGNRASGNGISLVKFGPSATGTSFGLARANLSIMASDAGSGQLAIGTINNSSLHFGTNNATRMEIRADGNTAINAAPTDYAKFHVRRFVDASAGPGSNLGAIYAENGSTVDGSGVYGLTFAPRLGALSFAGVTGHNIGTGADKFGVIGISSGSSAGGYSAGVGGYGDNGVLGWTNSTTGAGVIAQHGDGKTALEVNNGFIKVSGTNKSAFKHTTAAGNITSNQTYLLYADAASTDILMVTHDYGPSGPYLNKHVGVWWNGANWTIFLEDGTAMPAGLIFNVLVIKQ